MKEQQEVIREYVEVIAEVAATLEPGSEDVTEREERFEALSINSRRRRIRSATAWPQ